MTPERYQTLLRWLEARPALKKLVIALNRWRMPLLFMISGIAIGLAGML